MDTRGKNLGSKKMDDLLMKKEFESVSVIDNRNNGNVVVKVKKKCFMIKG